MDARERHETCVHADACEYQHKRCKPMYGPVWRELGCGACDHFDGQHCPMSWSGTMRCERRDQQ